MMSVLSYIVQRGAFFNPGRRKKVRPDSSSLIFSKLSDNKRQQTTTVDYKRLINGFFLTKVVSLQGKTQSNEAI
jgi:hypothetical protein